MRSGGRRDAGRRGGLNKEEKSWTATVGAVRGWLIACCDFLWARGSAVGMWALRSSASFTRSLCIKS